MLGRHSVKKTEKSEKKLLNKNVTIRQLPKITRNIIKNKAYSSTDQKSCGIFATSSPKLQGQSKSSD